MQTIYDADGKTKVCESVDAREHIESGRWFNEAPKVEEAKEPKTKSENSKMSKAELLELLESAGIEANAQMNKAELVSLLDEFDASK